MFKKLVPYLIFSILACDIFGQVIEIRNLDNIVNPGLSVQFLEDETNNLGIETVSMSNKWQKSSRDVPNFLLSKSSYWLKFSLQNFTSEDHFAFEITHPGLDEVDFYEQKGSGFYHTALADNVPVDARPIKNQNYGFFLYLPDSSVKTYYVRITNGDPIHVPIRIGTIDSISAAHTSKDIWFSLFTGILGAMLLANLFIYLSTREKSYLIYVVYIGIVYLTQANFQGYTLRWFLSEIPFAERYATYFLSASVGISAMFFMFKFLDITKRNILAGVFTSIYLLAVVLALTGEFQASFMIIEVNAAALATWMLLTAIGLWRRGSLQALNFVRAWIVFLVGVCIFVMKDFGILPYNTFTFNVMTIGAAFETVLLSFALADRINILKREKEAAQLRELEALQVTKQELQKQVAEQTVEITHQRDQALQNLQELRLTQRQLLESEKLSALGQMTAGIAHELNNPINFVSSNVGPLSRDVEEVVRFMNEFEELPDDADAARVNELKQRYHAADMPYIRKEIELLMKGIQEGARRTADIVKGLRIFARADRDALVRANINDCMEATLVVMKSAIKEEVILEKELDPELPEVDCFPGKLNQVFVNMIGNAIHATRIEGRAREDRRIWIRTWATAENLMISIRDNGRGMDEETRSRIFDPFYTTKGVGEGTGLGLSISLGILEEHRGHVEVRTEPGQGTEFLIEIPRNLKQIRNIAA